MEFQGIIKKLLPVRSGVSQRTGNEWKALPFVFEYYEHETDRYADSVVLETFDTNVIDNLKEKNPASINVCSLLVKPGNLRVPLDIKYAVMEIPNDFIVGYGLDYDQQGRNLRDIYTIVED